MSGYHYIQSEPGLWTVGTGTPRSQGGTDWEPESDHGSIREAAERVAWLNGGPAPEPDSDGLRASVAALVAQLGELTGALRGMAERMAPRRELIEPAAVSTGEERTANTPAEERTGISDRVHAVLEEVAALRDSVQIIGDEYAPLTALGMSARLDRIEQYLRGEQR
ncbi:hypothetical protein Drose_04535 [Dactylosporangium roseum]|uniref:Uncharacterized protein n=1 Tax=Dactylosporangium roseum TaxID=47989 RepID=A0ABY5Z9R7_9ACTN|nr:hypothetical protein [Dactylosporangium roseum]UWZ37557.1 hypothetical protein Drose_04535 [Dactylosporangium roseum]